MREIKFRAWDEDSMWFVSSMHYDAQKGGMVLGRVSDGGECFHGGDAILMQYTGLKDRNGKEIYEGDIVSWQHYEAEHEIQRAAPVTFENGCFYTIWQDSKYRLGGWKAKAIEVIGNIYSNPDLLEAS